VWVSFGVPEEVNRNVRTGMPVTVVLDGLPDRRFNARVIHQNPSADPLNRQFQVRAAIDNPGGLVKPGMFGRIKLVSSQTLHTLAVPREAVQQGRDGASVVVVYESNVAFHRPVTVGPSDTEAISITSGLQLGEKVVILSAGPVKDGATVRIGGDKPAGGGHTGREAKL
jgi:membrane fusion protein (multidrug efflux system)